MKILVACEFSGVVREAFRLRGHDAWSCDLLPSPEGSEYHLVGDALKYIERSDWDMLIAHPPCTYLCNGGNAFLNIRPDLKWRENRASSAEFFMRFINAPVPRICVENPIGCMSSMYRKPDQIIHPYHFGHEYRKDTCLWLKGLPKLAPTNIVPPPYKKKDFWSNKRNPGGYSLKSITYSGIAAAMAEQWGIVPTED